MTPTPREAQKSRQFNAGILGADYRRYAERSSAVGTWVAPLTVSLDRQGEHVEWEMPGTREFDDDYRPENVDADAKIVRAVPGLLNSFVSLAQADADRVARFVRRNGMLWLCAEHAWTRCAMKGGMCFVRHISHVKYAEPVEGYRQLAALFATLIDIRSYIGGREARMAPGTLWIEVVRRPPPHRRDWLASGPGTGTLGKQRRTFENVVATLLTSAELFPEFTWRGPWPAPAFRLVPGSLFGALVTQLAQLTVAGSGYRQCKAEECGRLFEVIRAPGRPPEYCPDCGERARWRRAQATSRAK